jgi:hypothetical protein
LTLARYQGWLRWLIVAAVVGTTAWWFWPLRPIQPPTGDGTFTDLSWRVPLLPGLPLYTVRGYAVALPAFDLGQPHSAEYRVGRLPDIGRECALYLAVDDPGVRWLGRDQEIRKFRGRLRLRLTVVRGEELRPEGRLSEWVWGHWKGAHRLYQMSAVSFTPRPDALYTLRVDWDGEAGLAGVRAYGYLECGGRK